MKHVITGGMYRPTWKPNDPRWHGFERKVRVVTRRVLLSTIAAAFVVSQTATMLSANTAFPSYAYPATAGTTDRTTPNRFADVRNILDFGADPTGILDSSAAVKAACAASGSNNLGEIFFPPGTYKFTGAVPLESGNTSFVIRGVGTLSKITCNMADFAFRRVIANPGSSVYIRVIENLEIQNTNTSPGTTINLLAGTSITSDGVTITITCNSAHGITIADTRLINISGVGGADAATYNDIWGVTATSSTVLSAPYTIRTLANGTGGTEFITPGGAIALNGSLRGIIQNCRLEGYYGVWAVADATISVYNCILACTQTRPAGSVGIITSGQTGIRDCDITSWETGIWVRNANGTEISGCRMEVNYNGIYVSGSNGTHIGGLTLESNQGNGLQLYGVGSCDVSGVNIIGSVASVNGVYVSGGSQAYIHDINVTGVFSRAAVTVENNINCQGMTFERITAVNNGAGTQTDIAKLGIQIKSCNFTQTYLISELPLSSAVHGTAPIEGDILLVSDLNAADAVWNGVAGFTAPAGTGKGVVRYSSTSNKWRVIGMYT